MKICCPQCGVKGSADDSFQGRQVKCPKCGQRFAAESLESVPEDFYEEVTEQEPVIDESVTETAVQEEDVEDSSEQEATSPYAGEFMMEMLSDAEEEPPPAPKISEDGEAASPGLSEDDQATQSVELSEAQQESTDDEQGQELLSPDVAEPQEPSAPSVSCNRCGKQHGDTSTYVDMDGELFCADCSPLVEDERSTLKQVAAAEATKKTAAPPVNGSADQPMSGANFTVGAIINRAWKLTSGVKAPVFLGMLIGFGGLIAVFIGVELGLVAIGQDQQGPLRIVADIVSSLLSTILSAGLLFMGVKRVRGKKVVWQDIFSGIPHIVNIIIAGILTAILIFVGLILFILPGIYLMVGYFLCLPLIIDKKMSAWQAMEESRKAIHKVWWKVFGLYLLIGLIVTISAIPFGIGLIWTIPLSIVTAGVLYAALFPGQRTAD